MRRLILAALAVAATLAMPVHAQAQSTATAIFAGGCFWCMEPPYDEIDGVQSTISGYTGGSVANPTYQQVVSGGTGHTEAVEITYDPSKVSYEQLLEVFWRNIDPFDADGQFCDRGDSYRAGVFYGSGEERQLAEAGKARVEERLGQEVVTEITQAGAFYPAEDYHQDYYEKNPVRYNFYRTGCRRDARLQQVWGAQGS